MDACPNCQSVLPVRGAFCPSCASQVRCKSCLQLLEPAARACVECGTLVGDGAKQEVVHGQEEPLPYNVLRLEETKNTRSLEARLSDRAVESLSLPLSAYFGGTIGIEPRKRNQANPRAEVRPPMVALPEDGVNTDAIVEVEHRLATDSVVDQGYGEHDRHRLGRLFSYENGRIRLKDSRLKAGSKKDFVGSLVCLFLYAHELQGRDRVARSAVNEVLTEASVYDGNARQWLATAIELMVDGDMLSLSVPGRERAVATLNRIDDSAASGSFELGHGSRQRTKKTAAPSTEGAEEAPKAANRRIGLDSKRVAPWVDQWKQREFKVDAYGILQGRSVADKGLFGLWAIRKAVEDEGRVVTRVKLAQFLYHAFELKVNDSSLAKALRGSDMKDRVIHVEGTRFQITPVGMAYVEDMISGRQVVEAATEPTAKRRQRPQSDEG